MKEAEDVLRKTGDPNAGADLAKIAATVDDGRGKQDEPLFTRRYKFPIFLAISIGMFNQLSGINAILYYLNSIFTKAGYDKMSGDLQAVAIGATNLLFTIVAMSVIDRIGRKKLLLIGSLGTAVAQGGVAAIFLTGTHQNLLVWCLMAFIAFFAFSQGAVIWVYLSEVFPNKVRAKGQSLGSFTHWIMNAIISGVFPVLAAKSGGIPFLFFSAMMLLQFVVVLSTYPETKGYSLEEMQKKLGIA
jgi:MFS transporter, SP family, arabinose:H+ symporter